MICLKFTSCVSPSSRYMHSRSVDRERERERDKRDVNRDKKTYVICKKGDYMRTEYTRGKCSRSSEKEEEKR